MQFCALGVKLFVHWGSSCDEVTGARALLCTAVLVWRGWLALAAFLCDVTNRITQDMDTHRHT